MDTHASPSRFEQVIAFHDALAAADLPHAIGGAIALGHYAEPRPIRDIDINVFVPPSNAQEVDAALADLDAKGPPVHLFFDEDELHAAMPAAVREVPFSGSTIPIVSPEHLVIRKATLDRRRTGPTSKRSSRRRRRSTSTRSEPGSGRLFGQRRPAAGEARQAGRSRD